MFSAERPRSFAPGPISPNTLVASTISSRFPERWSQRPTISSVRPPLWSFPPYTLAVSMKVTPCSRAPSRIAKESFSEVCGPKFMVPSTRRETVAPVRPSWEYCIADPSSRVGGVAIASRIRGRKPCSRRVVEDQGRPVREGPLSARPR